MPTYCRPPIFTMHYKNIINQRFGKLFVVERKPSDKYGQSKWLCNCDCGKQIITTTNSLLSLKSTSCGCKRTETIRKNAIQHNLKQPPFTYLYKQILKRDKDRKRTTGLTYDEFVEFTKINQCHYCGEHITWIPHHTTRKHPSAVNLDRIDSKQGYAKDNCVVCCYRCNVIKNNMNRDEFIQHLKKILSWQENRNLMLN